MILLRGFNENHSTASTILKPKCIKLFKEKGDHLWEQLAQTLDMMPFAVLIDEAVICMHSGVPKSNTNRLVMMLDIPLRLRNIEDCPLAFEVRF